MELIIKFFINFIGPIIATLAGTFAAYSYNIPLSVFYPNIAAIIIGIFLTLIIVKKRNDINLKHIQIISFFSILFLISTFFFPGLLNVHRWISILSIQLNISMIFLPILIYCINYFLIEKKSIYAVIIFIIVGVILTYQPDAGEATSFALAVFLLFILFKSKPTLLLTILIITSVVIYKSWMRVDLLEPVEYVEEILYMISSVGIIGYLFLLISAIFILYPFISMITKKNKALTLAFGVYLISSYVVTEFGHYPVPLFGAGASPIIGWYLMIAFMESSN